MGIGQISQRIYPNVRSQIQRMTAAGFFTLPEASGRLLFTGCLRSSSISLVIINNVNARCKKTKSQKAV